MTAPLQIRPAAFPPAGFSTAPPVRAWAAWCGPCRHGEHSLLIGRSARLDRAGWDACMAAVHAHAAQHKTGGRL